MFHRSSPYLQRPPVRVGNSTDKVWRTFTGTFRGSLLLSTQGMTGGLARAAPHRLDRSPEWIAPSGSWRALGVRPCGDPYCWYELVKEQRSPLGAPSGSELRQDLLHVLQVLALESRGQAPQQGRLPRCQPLAALLIPVRHSDPAAIPAADRLDGVAKREHFDVTANGSLAHSQLCCQV